MRMYIHLPSEKQLKKLVLSVLYFLRHAGDNVEELFVCIDDSALYDFILDNKTSITSVRICSTGDLSGFCIPIISVSPHPSNANKLVLRINKDAVPAIRSLPEELLNQEDLNESI